MKKLLTLLLFTASCLFSKEHKHELSICCIFQNDWRYLPEWIAFHKKQGVEHFYLYENLNGYPSESCLTPYIDDGIVTLVNWPYSYETQEQWNTIQCESYMHCVRNYGFQSKWMAFLDTDEFLFCPNFENLRHFLKRNKEYKAINARWIMYGTSNLIVPYGQNITDYLVYRVRDGHETSNTTKPIVQTRYIKHIVNPHYVVLVTGETKECPLNELRINHYWSRDIDFFYNVKLPRREKWYHDRQLQIDMEKEYNEVYDPILSNSRSADATKRNSI